ncbi:MAG: DUF5995 family protein [Acidimicrobiia bacterium]
MSEDGDLTTIEAVIDEMTSRWHRLHRGGDWRAVFARTYLTTTQQILAATRRPGVFLNPDWIVRIDCDFAHRYFRAFDDFERTGRCALPWQVAFQSARAKQTFILQDVLLGMNAHINFDLPHSLDATIPRGLPPEDLEPYRLDNAALNLVLSESVGVVQGTLADYYDAVLHVLNAVFGRRDEAFATRLIEAWRARAWGTFLVLRTTEATGEVHGLIEQSAVDNAMLLLEVQRHFPALYWPNRLFRQVVTGLAIRRVD